MKDASKSNDHKGFRALRTCAYVVIVIAGLKASADLCTPIILAAMLSVALMPPVRFLRKRRVPNTVAITGVVVGAMLGIALVSGIVGSSIAEFANSTDRYTEGLQEQIEDVDDWLEGFGATPGLLMDKLGLSRSDPEPGEATGGPEEDAESTTLLAQSEEKLKSQFDKLLQLIVNTAQGVIGGISDTVIVLLIMIFMMLEANDLPWKLRRAAGDPNADLSEYRRMTDQVIDYLSIKTGVSILTGLLAAGLTAFFGIDFPLLWGLVAFIFNYVPNVGSAIAAVPPVLLALVQPGLGFGPAAGVAIGYIAINMVVGNVLEPAIMGKRLGLSPLVVLLCLIFWNWVLGPVGMVLSVPLTMIVKIMLEHDEDFRPIGILLGPSEEETESPASKGTA